MTQIPDILHHGAINGVTGSCHQLVFAPGRSVLIDCGLFQGAEAAGLVDSKGPEDPEAASHAIEFSLQGVEALFLTHCHIDHVGRIPWLLAAGFAGPIIATEATAQLLPLVLEDALKIGVTRNRSLIKKVLARIDQMLLPVPFDQWTLPFGDQALRARFRVAGHILGSAYIEFDVAATRVLFSGDLGAPYTPLLQAPKSPYKADILVLESTYGDQDHLGRRTRRMQLKQTVEKALRDGGTILIPAFSMGRTQELLYELEQIIHRSGLPLWELLDVVVDSPLAAKFNRHYRSLSALWDKEARQRKGEGRHPLAFDHLITVESHADHLRLVQHLQRSGRAAIVIAASGMCSGGRIVNYLKALLPDKRTDLLFVGYQAVGTPGRDIQRYGPRGGYVLLDNERIDINAAVHTLGGYSAHADQKNLVDFVKRMRHKPKQIRIVHGDLSAKRVLQKLLQALVPDAEVLIPGEVMQ